MFSQGLGLLWLHLAPMVYMDLCKICQGAGTELFPYSIYILELFLILDEITHINHFVHIRNTVITTLLLMRTY